MTRRKHFYAKTLVSRQKRYLESRGPGVGGKLVKLKNSGSVCRLGSRADYCTDENVIYLSPTAKRTATTIKKKVYYLHKADEYWVDLNRIDSLDLYDITSKDKLHIFGEMVQPDLILFDKATDWIDPIEAIEWTSAQYGVPVILLSLSAKKLTAPFIRQAYSAGIYDIIYYPAPLEEVMESLTVLLKFPRIAR